jgi:hypothetical protein
VLGVSPSALVLSSMVCAALIAFFLSSSQPGLEYVGVWCEQVCIWCWVWVGVHETFVCSWDEIAMMPLQTTCTASASSLACTRASAPRCAAADVQVGSPRLLWTLPAGRKHAGRVGNGLHQDGQLQQVSCHLIAPLCCLTTCRPSNYTEVQLYTEFSNAFNATGLARVVWVA